MTKYVTTEEKVQCGHCRIYCAIRELVDNKCCPNCGHMVYILDVIRKEQQRRENERSNITRV
ncbi:hypothetical protein LCGC14_1434670 [marine sediment metagenome]|uniref:Uncharacterized protein n=1 Tax=marine sediment metagenome TaxID=412755 RepID=A0A0F9JN20_9ZZZZ